MSCYKILAQVGNMYLKNFTVSDLSGTEQISKSKPQELKVKKSTRGRRGKLSR